MADAKGAYIGGVPVQFKDAAARKMISDEYNSAETYAKGNLCIYNGKIYEAIKETTGTWDATAWEETTLAKVNSKLNGDIASLTGKIDKAIIVRTVQSETTFKLQANSGGQYNTDANLFPTIEGYTRACIVGARANGSIGIVVYDNSWFYNTTSQEKSFTVTLTWLFVKNGLI